MDSFATRRANLVTIAARFDSRRAMAHALDREESQLSRYLNGGNMGHKFARHVESKLDLPSGWMDHPHNPASAIDKTPLRHSLERFIDSSPSPALADTIARLLVLLSESR